MARKAESKRSNTPPCPGRIDPESFTEQLRLNKDSTRSPKVPNSTTMKAKPTQCHGEAKTPWKKGIQ